MGPIWILWDWFSIYYLICKMPCIFLKWPVPANCHLYLSFTEQIHVFASCLIFTCFPPSIPTSHYEKHQEIRYKVHTTNITLTMLLFLKYKVNIIKLKKKSSSCLIISSLPQTYLFGIFYIVVKEKYILW